MTHNEYLLRTLVLAEQRRGFCAPNPAVGAIIVKNNQVLAEGFHMTAGKAHAEIVALRALKSKDAAKGGSIYISLEPCCHKGRTGACTSAIIKAGIKSVYFAHCDPNPEVNAKSKQVLEAAGIKVTHIPVPEIEYFYQSYEHWQVNKTPILTAKIALTLDAKIAGKNGAPLTITGRELSQFTHHCRKRSDAIITSVNTINNDDPKLNVRLFGKSYKKPIYILDRQLSMKADRKILSTGKKVTLLHEEKVDEKKLQFWEEKGVRCIALPTENNHLNLKAVLEQLGADGVHDAWLESGGQTFQAFIQQGLVQRALVYIAPKTFGVAGLGAFGGSDDIFSAAKSIQWQIVGDDAVCGISF